MSKRIVIKTTLICVGIFLIINAALLEYIFRKYPIDTEKYVPAVIAISDIKPGTVIERKHVKTKLIQQSALNESMETDINSVIGKKAIQEIANQDYFRNNCLIHKNQWFKPDERIIVLPVSIEERLANLIKRGSYIDILLKSDTSPTIEAVLKKVEVKDMLDENGNPIDSMSGINSKTAYMKLVLDEKQRQRVYTSMVKGQFIYELYCDETQN